MMQPRKILLFLSGSHLQAYAWNRGELSEARSFSNDTDGREQFSSYLQQQRDPVYLLVDVIEEDFRHEAVPHLTGRNRRDLIARKFEHYYRNTAFRQARVLHRHTGGRRDDEMLFSALTNPQLVSSWLDILQKLRLPLVGIYSPSNLSSPLLKDINSEHVLLLSWEKHAGLRQTYFNHKRLHFSRLTPISDDSSFSAAVAAETPRMQHYLNSLNLPPQGETLAVYIICHAHDRQELERSLQHDLHCGYLDIQGQGQSLNILPPFQDSDATPIFLRLLASQPPAGHYANSTHTHYYFLWKLRWMLLSFAALIALAGALWSGILFWQARSYASQLPQATQLTRQAEAIQRGFPATAIPPADMKTAVMIARHFEQNFPPPEKLLLDLSRTLDQFTRIRPDKIAWHAGAGNAPESSAPSQTITFEGELTDSAINYRAALAYLDLFQQALTRQGYIVSAQKMPLDISPRGSISNAPQSEPEHRAQFTLQLARRRPQ